jgi:transcriptional regulator with XRE-family HTH domain
MEAKGVTELELAGRIHVDRVSVNRYRNERRLLTPEKIQRIADALKIAPEDLWRSPTRPSLDAMVKDAPDEVVQSAAQMMEIFLKMRGS